MKRLLLVNEDLQRNDLFRLPETRIIYKKNKTLIKDGALINKKFTDRLTEHKISWKILMEEWEVFNQDKIQVCMDSNLNPLKPIHVISYPKPDGIKALFQHDSMNTLCVSNDELTITRYTLNDYELRYFIEVKEAFTSWRNVPKEYREVCQMVEQNIMRLRNSENYDSLLYGMED